MADAHGRPECAQSGDPMFAVDDGLYVRVWNQATERLTGISAADAVGRPCWQLLGGRQEDGSLLCHARCSHARLAFGGWPVRRFEGCLRGADGDRHMALSTVVVRGSDGPLLIHLLHEPPARARGRRPHTDGRPTVRLTRRQLQVLELMAEGATARVISGRLGIAEPTVRNHIRAVLVELGCNSQLAAVAAGRAIGIID